MSFRKTQFKISDLQRCTPATSVQRGPCRPYGHRKGVLVAPPQALTAVLFHCPCTAITTKYPSSTTIQCCQCSHPAHWGWVQTRLLQANFDLQKPLIKWTLSLCKTQKKETTRNTIALLMKFIITKVVKLNLQSICAIEEYKVPLWLGLRSIISLNSNCSGSKIMLDEKY